jgi:hypothetical protein
MKSVMGIEIEASFLNISKASAPKKRRKIIHRKHGAQQLARVILIVQKKEGGSFV